MMNRKLKYGLPKTDRLHHRSLVNALFENGHSEYAYPLRMVYRSFPADDPALAAAPEHRVNALQFLVNIPKKKQRKAIHRVLLRRRIREAYRLARPRYEDKLPQDCHISVAILYISDRIAPYSNIADKMDQLLQKLTEKLQTTAEDAENK